MRTAELETVHYDRSKLIAASSDLIQGVAPLIDDAPHSWPAAIHIIRDSIQNELPQRFEWRTPLMTVV